MLVVLRAWVSQTKDVKQVMNCFLYWWYSLSVQLNPSLGSQLPQAHCPRFQQPLPPHPVYYLYFIHSSQLRLNPPRSYTLDQAPRHRHHRHRMNSQLPLLGFQDSSSPRHRHPPDIQIGSIISALHSLLLPRLLLLRGAVAFCMLPPPVHSSASTHNLHSSATRRRTSAIAPAITALAWTFVGLLERTLRCRC